MWNIVKKEKLRFQEKLLTKIGFNMCKEIAASKNQRILVKEERTIPSRGWIWKKEKEVNSLLIDCLSVTFIFLTSLKPLLVGIIWVEIDLLTFGTLERPCTHFNK